MKWKTLCLTTALLAALAVTPAHALDYVFDGPDAGSFGTPTSDDTIYAGTEVTGNVDRSKNTALIPPGFGTPTSYLPGSGELLTPNLAGNAGGSAINSPGSGGSVWGADGVVYPGSVITSGGNSYTAAYTEVTRDLYYTGGYLGTLKIPALDLSVKVYQGTDSAALKKGAGHFPDTSIWSGNVCLAAHNRGVNDYFGEIHTLNLGDTIKLTTKLGTRTYSVVSVEKIRETDSSMLSAELENCITLFTCVRNQSAYRWCVRAVEV